jgi:hypothetical protein
VNVIVDLRAVRPARLAAGTAAVGERVAAFRDELTGARAEPLADGVRLVLRRDLVAIARLADLVRSEADRLPFWSFRLLAEPPECWLEVSGSGHAGDLARRMFAALATDGPGA